LILQLAKIHFLIQLCTVNLPQLFVATPCTGLHVSEANCSRSIFHTILQVHASKQNDTWCIESPGGNTFIDIYDTVRTNGAMHRNIFLQILKSALLPRRMSASILAEAMQSVS